METQRSGRQSAERKRQRLWQMQGKPKKEALPDNGQQAQGREMLWSCKEAALGQKRKKNNLIWSELRWGVLKWKK